MRTVVSSGAVDDTDAIEALHHEVAMATMTINIKNHMKKKMATISSMTCSPFS